jgi:hypothetical protein
MRRTVDYRSALVMAAALGGSAFLQATPGRVLARQFRTGIEQLMGRSGPCGPYHAQSSWARIGYAGAGLA